MSFVVTSFMIYWAIVLRDRGLPEAWSGTVYALLILSMTLGGLISRRISRVADFRKVALLSTCAWGILFLAISFARSPVLSAVLFAAVEVVHAIRSAAVLAFENDITLQRNRAVVLWFVGSIQSATGIITGPLAGRVADLWGIRWLYSISAFLAFSAALCMLAAVKSGTSPGTRSRTGPWSGPSQACAVASGPDVQEDRYRSVSKSGRDGIDFRNPGLGFLSGLFRLVEVRERWNRLSEPGGCWAKRRDTEWTW